jgi:hypothetical protein
MFGRKGQVQRFARGGSMLLPLFLLILSVAPRATTVAWASPPPESDSQTEYAASSWNAWAQEAEADVSDDTSRVMVGSSSLRYETSGCFDTKLWSPVTQDADWDLSDTFSLNFWLYAANPNLGSQGFWIDICNDGANYAEFRPTFDLLGPATGAWVHAVVPLEGDANWGRVDWGSPDLSHAQYIEIHADTWDCSFTLWLDGMTFESRPDYSWPMHQRDFCRTGRADYTVPAERMNDSFFDVFTWQKPSPDSPNDGNFSSSAMIFYDGAGPGGEDVVVSGYHWPKGIQGMDRHTGRLFWNGNPGGGETIGRMTPAFSNDGSTVYVVNDATESAEYPPGHPFMAFSTATGPSSFRHNGGDTDPGHLSMGPTIVAPDGRIFLHSWYDRPYAGSDDGMDLTEVWAAQTQTLPTYAEPALYQDGSDLHVISGGESWNVIAWDGATGGELWTASVHGSSQVAPTIDPENGNIYLPTYEWGDVYVTGLDKDGWPLWTETSFLVHDYTEGVNDARRAVAPGCLSHDGSTYYFHACSEGSEATLYAINTIDGSVKWGFSTGGAGIPESASAPIVTENGILIIGNNGGDAYLAILDDGSEGVLLDSIAVNPDHSENGHARCSATLSPDGRLYIPMRAYWIASNGDGDVPTAQVANVYSSFDLAAGAHPQPLPPPPGQTAFVGNGTVLVRWNPTPDPIGLMDHYAIYRDTQPFTSVEGMTPIGEVASSDPNEYLDAAAENGVSYYYAVTSVIDGGWEVRTVPGLGPRTPYDETDLQVVRISRTPRYPRYDVQYSGYEVTDPNGFGPYIFSAATGLGGGQDENTQRWPDLGDPVTYTATVRNRATNPWSGILAGTWRVDGVIVAQPSQTVALAAGEVTTFATIVSWDGNAHDVSFRIEVADARPENNTLSINTKSVAFLSYIDRSRMEEFREETAQYPEAASNDFIDWLNRHMERFNQMFADAGCQKRVHFDILEVLDDGAADPQVEQIQFAIFPFRYRTGEGSLRLSGYYSPTDDIDFGLLHEMGHQLGLIDIYQINMGPDQNLVTHDGYSAVPCLMNGCSHFLSQHSANAMNHWVDKAHGYFGQYMYCMPEHVKMRFLGSSGQPLAGATVTIYQKAERPGMGTVITDQVKAQGATDSNGEWNLPNVPIDPEMVPPTYAGDVLHDNPFGYLAVIGTNGLFLIKVEKDGFADNCWLDVTEVNNAYWAGQTGTATFERHLVLGGTVQLFPPNDLTELNSASWAGWSDGGIVGLSDDTTNKQVGQGSLRFETTGGFDNYARYPGDRQARWNLSGALAIRGWFYAENPNPGFQERSPWIRLKSAAGFFEYRPTWDILNEAMGQWVQFVIPIAGDETWIRTTYGTPSLSDINSIEIHADTWGYGFALWMDGVGFQWDPTAVPGEADDLPVLLALAPNRPNPFSGSTELRFDLPREARTQLQVFDVTGRLVRDLLSEGMPAGRHGIQWNGRDNAGREVASGIYLLRMRVGESVLDRKMVFQGNMDGR